MVKSHIKIYTYIVKLPDGVNEAVMPCADGFTVYINENLDEDTRQKALVHALKHIDRDDWSMDDIQQIEGDCHANCEENEVGQISSDHI